MDIPFLQTSTATGLSAGMYTVTITDTNGCSMSSSTITTHDSFVELKANITVQSTTKQITQYIVSTKSQPP